MATLLPALTSAWPVVLASGVLFGAVFLSVVASTTALVRHNLPQASWPAGISAFTIVFAGGQIVGPTLVGWIADGPGGLGARAGVFGRCAVAGGGAGVALRSRWPSDSELRVRPDADGQVQRITSTGRVDRATTLPATLPSTSFCTPLRPCEPMTIRSTASFIGQFDDAARGLHVLHQAHLKLHALGGREVGNVRKGPG